MFLCNECLFTTKSLTTIVIIDLNRTMKRAADKQALVGNGLYRLSG